MTRPITHEQVGAWLDALASASPAPGGGAAAALGASIGASLICMVCNLTLGKPKYAAFEQSMTAALARAEAIRRAALSLADEDARAFDAVIAAYRLPRASDAEQAARSEAIAQASLDAAAVPLRTAELAAEVIELAAALVDGANANAISDVAVAAQMARAALDASLINVEINLAALGDAPRTRALAADLDRHRPALDRADAVVRVVRARIARP
jgi:formiminotetrahydrofolate cyclodeaminase